MATSGIHVKWLFSGRSLRCSLLKKIFSTLNRKYDDSGTRRYKTFNCPTTTDELQRPAGITSMFRLPVQKSTEGLDVCFVGVPLDQGTSNRPGARYGPRQIRTESAYISHYNTCTGSSPYEALQVADVGDVYINQYNLPKAISGIRESFHRLISTGCKTLAMGGDHSMTFPILQAIKERYGPVGLIHVDAHDDTASSMGGEDLAHGTTFYQAGEQGCLADGRVVQIGLRAHGYSPDEWSYAEQKGFRVVPAWDCYHRSLRPLMEEIRAQMGDHPTYLSFDIDALDPSIAPGTGTPEIGGLTSIQALEIIRGCRGVNLVGCDLVEVSPPYDQSGITAYTAANLLFEMLCVLPGAKYHTNQWTKVY